MSDAVDIDARQIIERTAFRLLRDIGFQKMSYSRIAEESGKGRPLVQYYYPKKDDIAISFAVRIMQLINNDLRTDAYERGEIEQSLHMGQAYYAFLLHDEQMCRLTYHILSNRQIMRRVIALNADHSLPSVSDKDQQRMLVQASEQATGGVYDLVCRLLEDGDKLDPNNLAIQNTAAFVVFTQQAYYRETCSKLSQLLLPTNEVNKIVQHLFDELFN